MNKKIIKIIEITKPLTFYEFREGNTLLSVASNESEKIKTIIDFINRGYIFTQANYKI